MNDKIAQVIEQAISGRIFPGAVIGYLIEGKPMVLPFGHLTYEHGAVKVTTETVYDVASITKSIPTSSLALQLIDQGKLSLDDYAVKYLPELKGQYMDRMRIRHLLTYTAVLQLEKGLGSYAREGAKKISQILFESPLVAPPGEKYVYTNAPAIWMGIIIERVMKQTLNIAAAEQLFEPLHMDRTTFSAEQFDGDEVAPTEVDWRGAVHGVPHDETAWILYRSGFVPGCAGLFSCAGDILTFARMLINKGQYEGRHYFSEGIVTQMHSNQLQSIGACTALGWELTQPHFMGNQGSDQIFGKTGYTGCLLVIDPVKERAMILLTNHTYPNRRQTRDEINQVRRDLADIIFA